MKRLRWKSRYNSGNDTQDQENKQLTQCLNDFVDASNSKEHCNDMDEVLSRLVELADRSLTQKQRRADIAEDLRDTLSDTLPLAAYLSPACRRCGICETVANQAAPEHLAASIHCLSLRG
jgi:hypothetical protein